MFISTEKGGFDGVIPSLVSCLKRMMIRKREKGHHAPAITIFVSFEITDNLSQASLSVSFDFRLPVVVLTIPDTRACKDSVTNGSLGLFASQIIENNEKE